MELGESPKTLGVPQQQDVVPSHLPLQAPPSPSYVPPSPTITSVLPPGAQVLSSPNTQMGQNQVQPFGSVSSSSPPMGRGKVKTRTKRKQVKSACANCRKRKTGCDDERPCTKCVRNGLEATCVDIPRKKRTSSRKRTPPGPAPAGQPMYLRWEDYNVGASGDPAVAANGASREAWKNMDPTAVGQYPANLYPRVPTLEGKDKDKIGEGASPGPTMMVARGGPQLLVPLRSLSTDVQRVQKGGPVPQYDALGARKLDDKNGPYRSPSLSMGQQLLARMYAFQAASRAESQAKATASGLRRTIRPINIVDDGRSGMHGDNLRHLLGLGVDRLRIHSDMLIPIQLQKALTDMFKDVASWPKEEYIPYWFTDVPEASRNISFWAQVLQFEERLSSMPSHSPKNAWLDLYTKWLTECVTTLDPATTSPLGKVLVVQEDCMSFNTISEYPAEEIRNFEEIDPSTFRTSIQVDRCCGYSPLSAGIETEGEFFPILGYGGHNVRMPYLLISAEPSPTSSSPEEARNIPGSARAALMGAAIVLEWRLQGLLEQHVPSLEMLHDILAMRQVLRVRETEVFTVPIFFLDGPRVELWSVEFNPKSEGDDTDPTSLVEGEGGSGMERSEGGTERGDIEGRYSAYLMERFDLSLDRPEQARNDLLRLAVAATNLINLAEQCKRYLPRGQTAVAMAYNSLALQLQVPQHGEEAALRYPSLPPSANMLSYSVKMEGSVMMLPDEKGGDGGEEEEESVNEPRRREELDKGEHEIVVPHHVDVGEMTDMQLVAHMHLAAAARHHNTVQLEQVKMPHHHSMEVSHEDKVEEEGNLNPLLQG